MNDIVLTDSTEDASVDDILRAVIGIFEIAFEQRIRGYYVEGSYANGQGITTSDLDLTIVFRNGFGDDNERHKALRLDTSCTKLSTLDLDFVFMADTELNVGVYPSLKASICVYGEDQRDHMQVLPIEQWTRERMHSAYGLLTHVFHRPTPVRYPVSFPDPNDPFGGYTQRKVQLSSGEQVNSTRDLIRVTGWIATAVLAYQAHAYVARKSECHVLYRKHIGDQWAQLIEDIYHLCRTRWNYYIPEESAGQATLRVLCEQTLRFENHFLNIYKQYLLQELQSEDQDARRSALRVLDYVPMDDKDIERAVEVAHER